MSRRQLSLILISLCLLGLGRVAAAEYAVAVIPPPAKEAAPGEFVTQVFTIENQGSLDDTYALEVTAPPGWTVLNLPATIAVPAGASAKVFVSVIVPRDARAGDYELVLRATSQHDPAVVAEGRCTITVRPVIGVEVLAPGAQEAQPGTTVRYLFTVRNTGNESDLFRITATSERGYAVEPEPKELALLPGEEEQVQVAETIPATAPAGYDRLTVTAASVSHPGISASASVLTRILPPGPEAVAGSLYLELPLEVELTSTLTVPFRLGDLDLNLSSAVTVHDLDLRLRLTVADLVDDPRVEGWRFALSPRERNLYLQSFKTVEELGLGFALPFLGGGMSLTLHDYIQTEAYKAELALWARVDDLSLSAQLATSLVAGSMDYAENLDLFWRPGRNGLAFRLGLFHIGPEFYGGNVDQEGFIVAHSVTTPLGVLLGSYRLARDNVEKDPTKRTTSQEVMRLAALLRLGEFTVALDYDRDARHSDDIPATVDRVQRRSSLGLAGRLSILSLSLTAYQEVIDDHGAIDDDNDGRFDEDPVGDANGDGCTGICGIDDDGDSVVDEDPDGRLPSDPGYNPNDDDEDGLTDEDGPTDDHFEITGMDLGMTARYGSLFGRFGVHQEAISSPTAVEDTSFRLDWGLGLLSPWLNGFLGVFWEEERHGLSFALNVAPMPDIWLRFAQCISSNAFTGTTDYNWTIGLQGRFSLPTPFAVKGRIEGHLFVDEDGDGHYDPGEEGIPGVVIAIDGVEVSTGAEGLFRTPPLEPGWYAIRPAELPSGLIPGLRLPVWVRLEAGETVEVDLPLRRVAAIEGLVYNDANRNGVRDGGEPGLANVRVALYRDGQLRDATWTNPQGRFSFVDLEPGDYQVKLDTTTLPERYEPTTPAQVEVGLAAGEREWVEFGAAEKERELIITYNPVAAFTFTPEHPKAGETVTFDASASYDPDGYIVSYEWDFNSDGVTDAEGKVVEHVFTEPGTYQVKLTVTDNDGFRSSATAQVEVTP